MRSRTVGHGFKVKGAYAAHDLQLQHLKIDPLRTDLRFADPVRRVGLPQGYAAEFADDQPALALVDALLGGWRASVSRIVLFREDSEQNFHARGEEEIAAAE